MSDAPFPSVPSAVAAVARREAEGIAADVSSLRGVVIASGDGFELASCGALDPQRIAALASSIAALGEVVSAEARLGRSTSVTVATNAGFAVVRQVLRPDCQLVIHRHRRPRRGARAGDPARDGSRAPAGMRMSGPAVESALETLVGGDGLLGCALVDIETGMVVHARGSDEAVRIAEAASDFWRLSRRHRLPFDLLGQSRAQVLIHQRARLTLVACGRGLLLVSMSDEPDRVDWARWKREVGRTMAAIAAM